MNTQLLLYCYICTAMDMDAIAFGNAMSSARNFYEQNKIRGLLVYDGRHFLHFITGSSVSIEKAQHRLETTTKAYNRQILYCGAVDEFPLEYPRWQIAYLQTDEDYLYAERLRNCKDDLAGLSSIFKELHQLEDMH